MLAIRLQRTGRKGHAEFRLIVQEARRSPLSGKVVANLGNYNPHTKAITVDKEKAAVYLTNGAQPSPRVAMLLKKEGVKLPSWVNIDKSQKSVIKNTEKLRRNRPAASSSEEVADKPAAEVVEPAQIEVPAEVAPETPAQEGVATPEEAPVAEASEPEAVAEIPTEEVAVVEAALEEVVSDTEAPEAKAEPTEEA